MLCSIGPTKEKSKEYELTIYSICHDPFCDCGTLGLRVTEKDSLWEPVVMVVDVKKKEMIAPKEGEEDYKLLSLIISDFDDYTWSVLDQHYCEQKLKITDQLTSTEGLTFDFDAAGFESGEMLPYFHVFPHAYPDRIHVEGIEYAILDAYCFSPTCRCTDSRLVFYKVLDGIRTAVEPSLEIHYDYKKGKWFNEGVSYDNQDALIHAYIAECPDFREKLKRRQRMLKNLYSDDQERKAFKTTKNFAAAEELSFSFPVMNKTGRNEPCPCGSGKKYKKCCGR